jgi:hypothetical protein
LGHFAVDPPRRSQTQTNSTVELSGEPIGGTAGRRARLGSCATSEWVDGLDARIRDMGCPLLAIPVAVLVSISRILHPPRRWTIEAGRRSGWITEDACSTLARLLRAALLKSLCTVDHGCGDCLRMKLCLSSLVGALLGGLRSLGLLPLLSPLPRFRTVVRFGRAGVVVLAARLAFELLLGDHRAHPEHRLRAKRALLEETPVPAVPAPELTVRIDSDVLQDG